MATKTAKIEGTDKGKLLLYALSTCIWCKKLREFLDEKNVAYEYIYVDILDTEEKEAVKEDIRKWNPDCSYPTLVINENKCLIGFDADEITKALGL
jgi:glutaredoxin-like protein NrdH